MATATFTQTGGSGTVTWSATGLPNGVSINPSSGDVTGTPTVTGTFNATVTATDAGGCTGSKNVTFMVKDPPQITSANSTTFAPGVAAQTFTVTTTGFPTNTITRTGTLPAGVTFTDNNNNTATIAGTPAAGTQAGSPYAWVITAANGAPPDATQNFTFNVTCPVITVSGTIPALVVNVAMTPVTFTQVGGNPPITWSATGLPTGLTINPATGDVTGTPTVTGTFNVTITASDVGACMGSKMQTVTVAPQAMNDSYAGLVDNTQFVITGGTTASPGTPFVGSTIKLTDNDQPSGSVSATAGTFATSAGGSVTIASDGTFVYTPKANPGAAATTSDSFTYTAVSNGVTSAPATVTLTLAERVWYVLNTAGGGNGQSQAPFNLLSDGIAASTANDTIFVYQGDGTTTNLATASTLKPGQHFLGQGVALVVNSNTLVPAGGFPLIGNAVTLANGVVVDGIDLATGTNSGVVGTSATGFTVTVRHLTTTTGTALGLDGTTGTVTMTSVTTNGGGAGATHVILTNVNGTVALNGGALAGSGGKAIDINGGTANVTYAGTIANSATGITVANKTGGAVTLSGASKTLNTAANTAVTLASNTGATIDLSGGGLDIDTTSGVGFSATGGGTVTVTGSGNTITSGTGTALNVTSTTIGAGGLTFQSIAANGASHGVVLSSTGTAGGLTVTGTGTAGSGGTIQNITDRGVSVTDAADISLRWMTFTNAATTNGADPTNPASGCGDLTTGGNLSCNAPIYLVNVSKIGTDPSVTLANLTITNSAQVGINVNNVDGLSLTDTTMSGMGNQTREYGIKARNLFGAVTFDNLSISSSFGDHVRIDNNGGQATTLNVIDSAFSTTTEGNGFTFNPNGTATTVVNIASSSFTNNFATGLIIGPTMSTAGGTVTIDVTGGPFTNNNAGIQIFGNGTADVTYDIHNIANISGNPAAGIQNDMSSLSLSTASLVGKIRSNTITMPASGAGNGIGLTARGAGTSTIQVSDNAVINTSQFGVFLHRKEGLTPGALNATVNDNTVTTSDVLADLLFPIDSIRVEAGAAAADTGTVCANITANTANGAGSQVDAPGSDIRLRHRFAHTFNVVVNAGGPTGPITGAQAAAALDVLNPASGTTDATTTTSFTGITAATGCPTP
jgi:hypothetical protein